MASLLPMRYENITVDWFRLLNAIGLSPVKNSLPLQLKCPLCLGNNLLIFSNTLRDGQWHYCRNCAATGNLVELASKVWKLSMAATLHKLSDMHAITWPTKHDDPEAAIERFEKRTNRLNTINKLVERSAEFTPSSRDLLRLLNKLYLNPKVHPDRFATGFGLVLGGMETLNIEATFAPRNVKFTHKGAKRKTCHTNTQIFRVGYWGEALVLPYYGLPGCVSRYKFIGREARPNLDMPVKPVTTFNADRPEGGLAFHPHILKERPKTIFIIEDMMVYLRFNVSHFSRGPVKPIPVVNFYDDGKVKTETAWSIFDGSRKIFWCWDITPSIILQAHKTSGDIAVTDIEDKSESGVRTYMQSRLQTQLLNEFEAKAEPWPLALENWADARGDAALENLLRTIMLREDNINQIISCCSRRLQKRCERLLDSNPLYLEITFASEQISDTNRGWWTVRTGHKTKIPRHLISEARLVIDKALYVDSTDSIRYFGKILYRDSQVVFAEDAEVIEQGTFEWMHKMIVKAGLGVPTFDASWSKRGVSLALQFRPAKIAEGLTHVGWNNDTNGFDFPNYVLGFGGSVKPQNKLQVFAATPCADMPRPLKLSPDDLFDITKPTSENAVFWTVMLATAANVVSPIFGYQQYNTVVSSNGGSKTALQAALAMGCCEYPLTKVSLPTILRNETRHSWPMAVGLRDKNQKKLITELVPDITGTNLLLHAGWWQARWLAMTGWTMLKIDCDKQLSLKTMDMAKNIMPSYLAHLLFRQTKLEGKSLNTVKRVCEDVCAWLADLNVDNAIVHRAAESIVTTEDSAKIFGDIVYALLKEEGITIKPETFVSGKSLIRTGQHIFIPQSILIPVLKEKTNFELSASDVTGILRTAGLCQQQSEIASELGWLVDENWLANVIQLKQKRKALSI